MKRKRRNHVPPFKDKLALTARKGEKTMEDLAEQYNADPNLQKHTEP